MSVCRPSIIRQDVTCDVTVPGLSRTNILHSPSLQVLSPEEETTACQSSLRADDAKTLLQHMWSSTLCAASHIKHIKHIKHISGFKSDNGSYYIMYELDRLDSLGGEDKEGKTATERCYK